MKENFKLIISTFWSQVTSLFFILLVAASFSSFYLKETNDGFIILTILLINLALGFYQEFKASHASLKLMHMVQSKVYVFRKGVLVQILTSELVLNDVVHLVGGSIVPVDIEVVESEDSFVDDSMRTGESMPKSVVMGETLFAGAVVTGGKISGRVIALGEHSSISKYRAELESVKKWSSFGVFANQVVKYVFVISLATLILAMYVLVFVSHKYDIAEFIIFAIAMLVGVVPEVLPLIITLVLTSESLTLAKNKVLVKRLSSLEGLGAVQFLLTDKTGTITENKLKVSFVSDVNNFWEVSNAVTEGVYERTPMDEAYDNALNSSIAKLKTHAQKITHFQPFNKDTGYSIFTTETGEKIARGVASKVLALCKHNNKHKSDEILKSVLEYESKGMRVLALAYGIANTWSFAGFVAYYDPIKSDASASLKTAHTRGVMVKILTGDSALVAANVAEELGLIKSEDNVVSLEKIKVSALSDKQLLSAVVFAKCTPDNKLELIDRYLKLGPVAFLGDGINDALGLKRADIGIAVDNAADIAKESADVILLEKDLNPILNSISMGRRALSNITTYIIYTLSGNAGTFFSLLIASFFYSVLPMLPIQILLNNLLTDLPLLLISTDNPDPDTLRHVPHFNPRKIMQPILVFGIISSFFDFLYFQIYKNTSVAEFQTGWFVLSVLAELVLILSIRSSKNIFKASLPSVPLATGIVIAAVLPFIFIYNSFLAGMFKFTALSTKTLFSIFAIIIVYIVVNESAKFFMRKKNIYRKPAVLVNIFK